MASFGIGKLCTGSCARDKLLLLLASLNLSCLIICVLIVGVGLPHKQYRGLVLIVAFVAAAVAATCLLAFFLVLLPPVRALRTARSWLILIRPGPCVSAGTGGEAGQLRGSLPRLDALL